jgi:hypothetical protein
MVGTEPTRTKRPIKFADVEPPSGPQPTTMIESLTWHGRYFVKGIWVYRGISMLHWMLLNGAWIYLAALTIYDQSKTHEAGSERYSTYFWMVNYSIVLGVQGLLGTIYVWFYNKESGIMDYTFTTIYTGLAATGVGLLVWLNNHNSADPTWSQDMCSPVNPGPNFACNLANGANSSFSLFLTNSTTSINFTGAGIAIAKMMLDYTFWRKRLYPDNRQYAGVPAVSGNARMARRRRPPAESGMASTEGYTGDKFGPTYDMEIDGGEDDEMAAGEIG